MSSTYKGYAEPGAGLKAEQAERARELNLRIAHLMRKEGMTEPAAKARAISDMKAEDARRAEKVTAPPASLGTVAAVMGKPEAAKPGAAPAPAPKAPEKVAAKAPEKPPKPAPKKPTYSGVALRSGKIFPYWTEGGSIRFGPSRPTELEAAQERDRILVERFGFDAVRAKLNFPEMFREAAPDATPAVPGVAPGATPDLPGVGTVDPREVPDELRRPPAPPKGFPRTILLPKPEDAPPPDPDAIERSIASFDRPAPAPEVTFDPREPKAVPHGAPAEPTISRFTVEIATGEVTPLPAPEAQHDPVDRPAHYDLGGLQPIDVIEAMGIGRGFCVGNAIKYLMRAGRKAGESERQDIAKARWYVDRALGLIEKEGANSNG